MNYTEHLGRAMIAVAPWDFVAAGQCYPYFCCRSWWAIKAPGEQEKLKAFLIRHFYLIIVTAFPILHCRFILHSVPSILLLCLDYYFCRKNVKGDLGKYCRLTALTKRITELSKMSY